jgi:formylglycine-generating enzyme required for sulfatase activity
MSKTKKTPKRRISHLFRGGGWTDSGSQSARAAFRSFAAHADAVLGFRLVEVLDEQD